MYMYIQQNSSVHIHVCVHVQQFPKPSKAVQGQVHGFNPLAENQENTIASQAIMHVRIFMSASPANSCVCSMHSLAEPCKTTWKWVGTQVDSVHKSHTDSKLACYICTLYSSHMLGVYIPAQFFRYHIRAVCSFTAFYANGCATPCLEMHIHVHVHVIMYVYVSILRLSGASIRVQVSNCTNCSSSPANNKPFMLSQEIAHLSYHTMLIAQGTYVTSCAPPVFIEKCSHKYKTLV